MKPSFLIALLFLTLAKTGAQTPAGSFRKHNISTTGCTVYNYCEPKYKLAYSADSSKVYTGECVSGDFTFGVICVRLLNPVTDLNKAEELLIKYCDYLKGSFSITQSVGYGKGHRLNNNEATRGVIDYWQDADNDKWKIKAWTDGKFIGFMYVYGKKELPEAKVNLFLDGFRFPVR